MVAMESIPLATHDMNYAYPPGGLETHYLCFQAIAMRVAMEYKGKI